MRKLGSLARPPVHFYRKVKEKAGHSGGYSKLAIKALKVARREGLQGVRSRFSNAKYTTPVITPTGQAVDRNDYQEWIKRYDTLDAQAVERIKTDITGFKTLPKISVVMPVYNAPLQFLEEAINSVKDQIYTNWELCIADDASTVPAIRTLLERYAAIDPRIKIIFRSQNGHISAASNTALKMAIGEWVALLDQDDLLSPYAFFWVVKGINDYPNANLIYSDEDKLDEDGRRCEPFFKPKWSPHLAFSQAYLGHLVVFNNIEKKHKFNHLLSGAQDYNLWLSLAADAGDSGILHIPKILYHWRKHTNSTASNSNSKPYAHEAGRKAVENYAKMRYPNEVISVVGGDYLFTYKIDVKLPENLLASIIIPTKDRVDLLDVCIKSIVRNSGGINYEVIVLNNNSSEPETFQYFDEIVVAHKNIRVIDANIDFNWSKLNNIGAKNAKGNVFVFLNNDTQVISGDWLNSLCNFAILPDVGVVGGLLFFEDNTIQHSGVVVGMGGWADHVYRTCQPEHTSGQGFVSPMITRNVLAVTGACMTISREKFNLIGGFDEEFIICGSDVEICIRSYNHGLYNIMCAEAKLFHFESKTRTPFVPKNDFDQSELKYAPYRIAVTDPFYNPNLSLASTKPCLDGSPRAE